MKTAAFDFELPAELIALHPASPRDAARLLVVDPVFGAPGDPVLHDRHVRDLPELLRPGDMLVVNDTRVIPAALKGVRQREEGTARIEVNLHRRLDGHRWLAFARPAKRLATGDRLRFGRDGTSRPMAALAATVAARGEGGEVELIFDLSGPDLDAALAVVGDMPLPPYIASRRETEPEDARDYQTLFAARDGAVAAPTAGLHFTPLLLERLAARGIGRTTLTLHVGAGTFVPVKAEHIGDHRMHAEWGEVSPAAAEAINRARAAGGRIVAVGSTSMRLLETAADERGHVQAFAGETDIFITPGHRFRVVDLMMTNFHLPRSTLFMLVAAFSGLETMKQAYAHAIASGYRFYSFGDATLLTPARESRPPVALSTP